MAELFLAAVPLTLACFALARGLFVFVFVLVMYRFLSYVIETTFARNLPLDLFAFGVFVALFAMIWLALASEEQARSS